MSTVSIQELVDAGFHFGHRTSKWNPKMKPFIFGKRNLIHIINLRETVKGLVTACKFLTNLAQTRREVLFVGTKWQAREITIREAQRCGMPYVSERWLGGTLTNFDTIRKRLERLEELENLEKTGGINQFSKKAISSLNRERKKILTNLEGIRNMNSLPGVLVIVDPKHEHNAVNEAKKLGIPTVCLADTDCDPEVIDICVPGNDDAIRSIDLFLTRTASAILAGKELMTAGAKV
ncbi:MAG: 30S ribosomal protein S2 [Candidatus Brocadia fulgida]|uniref:Small ribosomal subunit protein uS2 n=1 Tax=Candidatus Brocadia fulgida TaxID=380242 RepID=A0A0M2UYU9_9BACT|nr:MAG: 30S ribosomal protein S2 [Candidatus Brocadia fulgida]